MSKKKLLRSNKITYDGPSWNVARKLLRSKFQAAGLLNICELKYEECEGWPLTFAHSKRRNFISSKEEMITVIRACQKCHSILDANKHDVTEEIVLSVINNRVIPVESIFKNGASKENRNKRRRKTVIQEESDTIPTD